MEGTLNALLAGSQLTMNLERESPRLTLQTTPEFDLAALLAESGSLLDEFETEAVTKNLHSSSRSFEQKVLLQTLQTLFKALDESTEQSPISTTNQSYIDLAKDGNDPSAPPTAKNIQAQTTPQTTAQATPQAVISKNISDPSLPPLATPETLRDAPVWYKIPDSQQSQREMSIIKDIVGGILSEVQRGNRSNDDRITRIIINQLPDQIINQVIRGIVDDSKGAPRGEQQRQNTPPRFQERIGGSLVPTLNRNLLSSPGLLNFDLETHKSVDRVSIEEPALERLKAPLQTQAPFPFQPTTRQAITNQVVVTQNRNSLSAPEKEESGGGLAKTISEPTTPAPLNLQQSVSQQSSRPLMNTESISKPSYSLDPLLLGALSVGILTKPYSPREQLKLKRRQVLRDLEEARDSSEKKNNFQPPENQNSLPESAGLSWLRAVLSRG